MSQSRIICSIYRSKKKDEMYLYVDKAKALSMVPETLIKMFGKPEHRMDMLLTADKQLSRAKAQDVLSGIKDKGYYLQMPPVREEYMLDLYKTPVNPTY
ncbi:MAG: YcgL domain-containing protein [Gammaproteobacteria bacterium]|nr:YcgL domain-containing protein [Gammaproteobacteria bacterium]